MRKILILTTLAAFFSCSSDDGSTATTSTATSGFTNLPNNLTQPLAKGLTGKGTAAAAAEALEVAAAVDSSAQIYKYIQQDMSFFNGQMGTLGILYVVLDEQIGSLTSGTCSADYQINFTDELVAKILAKADEYGLKSDIESMVNGFKGTTKTATEVQLPAIKIEDIDKAGYTKQITLAYNFDSNYSWVASCTGTNSDIIRFNADKTKLQIVSKQKADGMELTMQVTNDDSANKSTIKFTGDGGSFNFSDKLSFRPCSSTEAANTTGNCNVADLEINVNFTTSPAFSGKIKAQAKVDEVYGYGVAKTSFTSGGTTTTAWYKEAWAGNGNTLYVGSSADGTTYTDLYGSESSLDSDYVQSEYTVQSPWTYTSSVTADGTYFIVISGENPTTNGDAVVGSGYKDSAVSSTLEWDFWGAGAGTYDIYKYDPTNNTATDQGSDITVAAASN